MKSKNTIEIEITNNVVAPLFGLVMCCVTLFFAHFLADPDTYWHVAVGQWILNERAIPRYDSFSYSVSGRPWVDGEWLSEIVLALTYRFGGWRGLVLLSAALVSLTYVLLYELLARKMRATVVLGIAVICFVFASFNFLARPHLFALPIIVVWTALLAKAAEENRRPNLLLLPLMVIWANLHRGFTLGLVLAIAFAADAVITSPAAERRRISIAWGGFLIGAVLASCLTPYGYNGILETFHAYMLGGTLNFIGEMRPVNFLYEFPQEVILLCLLGLGLTFGVKLGLTRVLMLVGLLFLGFNHVRGLAIVALTAPFIVAYPLLRQFAFLRASVDISTVIRLGRFGHLLRGISRTAFPVGVVLLSVSYMVMKSNESPRAEITPAAALEYASNAQLSGPVLNDYDFGGYLIFRGIKTFVDGRAIHFGREFLMDVFTAMSLGGADKLETLANKYKATWTLVRPSSIAALYLDGSPNWRRVYTDEIAVIHIRREDAVNGQRSFPGDAPMDVELGRWALPTLSR
jgi:hypothetical protein